MKWTPPGKGYDGNWRCAQCRVMYSINDNAKIVAHLKTKKHKRLQNACPRCSSLRMKRLAGECWDRDGIREALKCQRCNTEYKCFAHGWKEKDPDEYTGAKPPHIVQQEFETFDRAARMRGYIPVDEANERCTECQGRYGEQAPSLEAGS